MVTKKNHCKGVDLFRNWHAQKSQWHRELTFITCIDFLFCYIRLGAEATVARKQEILLDSDTRYAAEILVRKIPHDQEVRLKFDWCSKCFMPRSHIIVRTVNTYNVIRENQHIIEILNQNIIFYIMYSCRLGVAGLMT